MPDNPNAEPGYTRPTDGLKERIFFRMLPIESRSVIGWVLFVAIIVTAIYVGVNEGHRMGVYTKQYDGRSIQRGATIFHDNCSPCHGARGEGTSGVAPALNTPDMFDGSHLKELGWAGTLEDFIKLTVSAGRPARSNPQWPNPMPTWSQDYGGPLRPDQVQDVVNFVLNWGCAYDPQCAGPNYTPAPTYAPGTPTPTAASLDVAAIVAALPQGDPTRGDALFHGTQPLADGKAAGCNACHSTDGSVVVGPSLQGIADPAGLPPGYTSVQQYLVESIYKPSAYIVPGFQNLMPPNFSQRMSPDYKDLADIIAYLLTLK